MLGGYMLFMICSIGVVCYFNDGIDGEIFIKYVDIVMYCGKQIGCNNFQFYILVMNEQVLECLCIEGDLCNVLDYGEFLLYYQFKVDLVLGCVVGSEVLICWLYL